jgi:hypothetical protein
LREKLSAFESTEPTGALVIVHPVTSWADYGTLITLAAAFTRTDLILLCPRSLDKDQLALVFLLPTLSISLLDVTGAF